jgi:acetoacetyl-CoA synthetase
MAAPLWVPSADRIDAARLTEFRRRYAPAATDFDALHRWSVERREEFWAAVWDFAEVIGHRGERGSEHRDAMPGARFFPDSKLNYARNLLRGRDGSPAVITCGEGVDDRVLTWRDLRREVGRVAAALRADDVSEGDCVVAWLPNIAETVVVFLAAASIGATFSSCSPDFGPQGVLDRFGQVDPVVLVAADGYRYGGKPFDTRDRLAEVQHALPTLRRTVLVANLHDGAEVDGTTPWLEWLEPHADASLEFAEVPFDHPIYVLFSSGTTGVPKCIVHRAGGVLLKHFAEHQLQCDIRAGDRVLFFTTAGWMMWNWLVGALASSSTIVLVDGSPFHPNSRRLFDLCDRHDVTLLGVGAKFIDSLRNEGATPRETNALSFVRTICSTGSPLVAEGFEYVYDAIKSDVHLASISGGTDLCGCLVMGDPTRPVAAGEIQGPALGVAADVFGDDGTSAPVGVTGELVATAPFPSMPLRFGNDPDGARYRAAYFERFPDTWAHGDFACRTESGGFVITGRSDATLNPGGVRIGTAEIYRAVEALPEVVEALAIGQPWQGDVRVVLFVRLADADGDLARDPDRDTEMDRGHPCELSAELETRIRNEVRTRCSPRHVPARIVAVADLPRTRSGKLAELAVADVVAGRMVRNTEALANAQSLALFKDLAVLAD